MKPHQYDMPALLVRAAAGNQSFRIALHVVGFFFALASAGMNLSSVAALAAASEGLPASAMQVAVQQGLLTLNVRNAPLVDLLRLIGERGALLVSIHGEVGGLVTDSFTDLPLDEGIRRLVRGHALVLIYAPSPGRSGVGELAQVRIYEATPTDLPPEHADATKPAAVARPLESHRSAKLRETRALARQRDQAAASALAQIMAQDADPTVRAKAAAALGKIGGGESAAALSTALADQDALVRVQATRALRQVEGDRAAQMLQGVLTGDPDPRVRRQAARALGAIRSEEARWVLKAVAWDPDPSVRRAIASALAQWEKARPATQ